MRRGWIGLCLVLGILVLFAPPSVRAEEPVHVVQRGESLSTIAARYRSSVQAIVSANKLQNPDLIWVGQRLRIPSEGNAAVGSALRDAGVHVVQPGEVLSVIALRYGTTPVAIAMANKLRNPNLVWPGQRLRIPAGNSGVTSTSEESKPGPVGSGQSGKWIEVILRTQTVLAWDGDTLVRRMIVSTGLPRTPTVTGRFRVYAKYINTTMAGPGYYLPGVPHTMYFYRGYSLHGTYWHNNFGRPMSHGCVNLTRADAAWLYDWTPMSTLVVVHW